LLIIGEIYNNITNKLVSENKLGEEQIAADLQKNNESFSNISESLQRSILDIRKLPIGKVLQKANKIIRDICTKQNKKIRINITGDQILLDKSLVEPLDGALVHIFRNAADHGVEDVEKRIASNKNPEGLVDISCTDNEEFIFITIRDDGAGIKLEKLKNKAVQKGLIEQNVANNLTKEEILDLIFLPGLSMSEQISDISGRGVGMDVVKQNIAAIGGKISLDREEGKGTAIKISVQKSYLVKIINGFVVRVADNKFILSLEYIGESVEFKNSAVNLSPDGNEYVLFHKQNYSLVRFNKIFEDFKVEKREDEIGVMISKNNKKFILVIDEIIGILKVVVKDVESLGYLSDKITGFALLGDDSIASVLDLEKACFSKM
jgi:two-component system chemotaxis sensor kinase CheA